LIRAAVRWAAEGPGPSGDLRNASGGIRPRTTAPAGGSSRRSIAHFFEQRHNLTPPGPHFFYMLVDVLKLTSQRFDHRRARRKIERRFAEAGARISFSENPNRCASL